MSHCVFFHLSLSFCLCLCLCLPLCVCLSSAQNWQNSVSPTFYSIWVPCGSMWWVMFVQPTGQLDSWPHTPFILSIQYSRFDLKKKKKKKNLHWLVFRHLHYYRQLSLKVGMMVETTKLYIVISVRWPWCYSRSLLCEKSRSCLCQK